MIHRRMFLRGLTVLALVVAVGACSSSGKNTSTAPPPVLLLALPVLHWVARPTNGSGPAQPTGVAIKVGLVCSCSGPFEVPVYRLKTSIRPG